MRRQRKRSTLTLKSTELFRFRTPHSFKHSPLTKTGGHRHFSLFGSLGDRFHGNYSITKKISRAGTWAPCGSRGRWTIVCSGVFWLRRSNDSQSCLVISGENNRTLCCSTWQIYCELFGALQFIATRWLYSAVEQEKWVWQLVWISMCCFTCWSFWIQLISSIWSYLEYCKVSKIPATVRGNSQLPCTL